MSGEGLLLILLIPMARNDMWIKTAMDSAFTKKRLVASGAVASIQAGTPTKENGSNVGVIAAMVDADGTTSQRFAGLSKNDSTDTAAAAGIVYTWTPLPGLVYAGKAKTASLANTQALIDALVGKRVVFDLTGGAWTVDTSASDASTNCVICAGGEYQTSLIYFQYSPQGQTYF